MDPLTSYEEAEAVADERSDEYRYENDWAAAVEAAREELRWHGHPHVKYPSQPVTQTIWSACDSPNERGEDCSHVLRDFAANHGTAALLRVVAQALELSQ